MLHLSLGKPFATVSFNFVIISSILSLALLHKFFLGNGDSSSSEAAILLEKFPTCWHNLKNNSISVTFRRTEKFRIACVSSGYGRNSSASTIYIPNLTIGFANTNLLESSPTLLCSTRIIKAGTSLTSSCKIMSSTTFQQLLIPLKTLSGSNS